MKTIFCFTILLLMTSITFSQSVLHYQIGTGIEVQAGADVSADQVIINGTISGGGTINGGTIFHLNLTAFIEGFYNSVSDVMVPDSITVYLRNEIIPYSIVDSSKALLNSSGVGEFYFLNAHNETNYYIVIKHRNSIETWSILPIAFSLGTLTYDFSIANTQAYGDNEIMVDDSPVRFAIYSSDVNQDGFVNLIDIINVNNDGKNFLTGYVPSDVNGDNTVNLADLLIVYNNSSAFVSIKRP